MQLGQLLKNAHSRYKFKPNDSSGEPLAVNSPASSKDQEASLNFEVGFTRAMLSILHSIILPTGSIGNRPPTDCASTSRSYGSTAAAGYAYVPPESVVSLCCLLQGSISGG